MSTELTKIENVLINGDLAQLSPNERVFYYNKVCESTGLNPLTRPFEYIKLNGKLTLYARKDCTDQLRVIHGISIRITAREKIDDVYIVTASALGKDGRCDESTGAVNVAGLKGEYLANAFMKAETKAKRRVTLSIAGLGLLDENEVESIPNAEHVSINIETGEIVSDAKQPEQEKTTKSIANESTIENKSNLILNKINLANNISKIYADDDKLGGLDYWSVLKKEEKEAVWPILETSVKTWIKSIMANTAAAQ